MSKTDANVLVKIVQLDHAKGLPLPQYQSKEAAGLDLVAAVPERKPINLAPGKRELVATGISIELKVGTEAQVRPRSGLALKHGVTVLNAPGTIDSDYRGEIQVMLINHGDKTFKIKRGERIAQLVIASLIQGKIKVVRTLSNSERGKGGFGSTGMTTSKTKKPRQATSSAKTKRKSTSKRNTSRNSSSSKKRRG